MGFPKFLFPNREAQQFEKLIFTKEELDFLIIHYLSEQRRPTGASLEHPWEYIISVGPTNFMHLKKRVEEKVRSFETISFIVKYISENVDTSFNINHLSLKTYLSLANTFKVLYNNKYIPYKTSLGYILSYIEKVKNSQNSYYSYIKMLKISESEAKKFDEKYLSEYFIVEERTDTSEYRNYLSELEKYNEKKTSTKS